MFTGPDKLATVQPGVVIMAYLVPIIVYSGSFAFHASLTYTGQLLDELPMYVNIKFADENIVKAAIYWFITYFCTRIYGSLYLHWAFVAHSAHRRAYEFRITLLNC